MAGAHGGSGAGFGGHLAGTGRYMLADARHPIGGPAEEMRLKARALMRSLSGARDAQGALDAIDDLAKHGSSLSPRTVATLRRRLTASRDAAESASLTPDLRRSNEAYIDEATQALEAS